MGPVIIQLIFFGLLLIIGGYIFSVGCSDPFFSVHWLVIGGIIIISSIIGLIVIASKKGKNGAKEKGEEIEYVQRIQEQPIPERQDYYRTNGQLMERRNNTIPERQDYRTNGQLTERRNNATITSNCKYSIDGCRGRHIDIYENKAVITTKTNLGSIMAGGYSNGEKTIYYRDVIGIQFKLPTFVQIGYLQFETASCQATNNFFSENSFPFESSNISNREIEKVVSYVKDQVDKIRSAPTSTPTVIQAQSPADELKKFKELLDMGVITQDEFDQKKKQLLSL